MLFLCQLLLNFQGAQALIQVRSLSKSYLNEKGITKDDVGYIGDDLNDYKSMELASWIACPQNGCEEIKKIANYVNNKKGGDGAVRDIIEKLLREEKVWEIAINNVY